MRKDSNRKTCVNVFPKDSNTYLSLKVASMKLPSQLKKAKDARNSLPSVSWRLVRLGFECCKTVSASAFMCWCKGWKCTIGLTFYFFSTVSQELCVFVSMTMCSLNNPPPQMSNLLCTGLEATHTDSVTPVINIPCCVFTHISSPSLKLWRRTIRTQKSLRANC